MQVLVFPCASPEKRISPSRQALPRPWLLCIRHSARFSFFIQFEISAVNSRHLLIQTFIILNFVSASPSSTDWRPLVADLQVHYHHQVFTFVINLAASIDRILIFHSANKHLIYIKSIISRRIYRLVNTHHSHSYLYHYFYL